MYLEIIERDEKVGEVHVNPFSYTYNGEVSEIEDQLAEWEAGEEIVSYGAADVSGEETPYLLAETEDVSEETKLIEIGSEIVGIEVDANIVE